jgi:hypothetical protein
MDECKEILERIAVANEAILAKQVLILEELVKLNKAIIGVE